MENLNYVEGMDVINVGLGAVLYDINSGTYYTPNTGQVTGGNEEEETAEKVEETEHIENTTKKQPISIRAEKGE